MVSQIFRVGGFSELGTGSRDYGMGIVRIDWRQTPGEPIRRHDLVKITCVDTKRHTYAAFRLIDPNAPNIPVDVPLLCMEYDDRLLLGVEKGEERTFAISRAGLYGQYRYFQSHPNVVIRAYTRYTFLVGLLGAAVGAIVTSILRFLINV